jgi:hypothetical protein
MKDNFGCQEGRRMESLVEEQLFVTICNNRILYWIIIIIIIF